MVNEHIIEAVNGLIGANKIPNLHVRLPADELPDGGLLLECDTCDNLFFNSQNHWVKFYVKIYPSDFSSQPQDIDNELVLIDAANDNYTVQKRIICRIFKEYKRVTGK